MSDFEVSNQDFNLFQIQRSLFCDHVDIFGLAGFSWNGQILPWSHRYCFPLFLATATSRVLPRSGTGSFRWEWFCRCRWNVYFSQARRSENCWHWEVLASGGLWTLFCWWPETFDQPMTATGCLTTDAVDWPTPSRKARKKCNKLACASKHSVLLRSCVKCGEQAAAWRLATWTVLHKWVGANTLRAVCCYCTAPCCKEQWLLSTLDVCRKFFFSAFTSRNRIFCQKNVHAISETAFSKTYRSRYLHAVFIFLPFICQQSTMELFRPNWHLKCTKAVSLSQTSKLAKHASCPFRKADVHTMWRSSQINYIFL